jgi:hypothetical protein
LKIAIFETLKIIFLSLVSDSTIKLEDAHSKLTHHETAQAQNDPRKKPPKTGPSSKLPELKTAQRTKRLQAQNGPRHKTAHIIYKFLYT